MTILHSLISNTIWRSAGDFSSRLISAVFWILVTRHLGAHALGSITFALSLFSFFELLSSLGLGSVLTRDAAKDKALAGQYFSHALLLGALAAVAFTGVMAITAFALRPNADSLQGAWIMAAVLPVAVVSYFSRALLQSAEKMYLITIASVVENIIQLGAGWVMMAQGGSLFAIIWVMVAGKLLATFLVLYFAVVYVARPVWVWSRRQFNYLWTQVPSFMMISILNSLFWTLAVILVTKLQGETQAGYFSAAFRLVSFFLLFATAYGQALFPVAARMAKESQQKETYTRILRNSLKVLFLFSLLLATTLSLLAGPLVHLLYGSGLAAVSPVLKWLVWVLVPYSAVPALAYTLLSHRLQKMDLLANLSGTLVMTAILFLLVPKWGAKGAAIAMVLGATVFSLVEYSAVHRSLFRQLTQGNAI